MIIAFFYFGFACACGVLANTRRRNGFGWFVLALLISPILAAAFLLALPKLDAEPPPPRPTAEQIRAVNNGLGGAVAFAVILPVLILGALLLVGMVSP
jgi:NADH:ubiquinone oxidoreductase subunit 6 (subunit J)